MKARNDMQTLDDVVRFLVAAYPDHRLPEDTRALMLAAMQPYGVKIAQAAAFRWVKSARPRMPNVAQLIAECAVVERQNRQAWTPARPSDLAPADHVRGELGAARAKLAALGARRAVSARDRYDTVCTD